MGVHYLIIYKDLDILRTFYTQYAKIQTEKNNEAVLINPFYETADSVRQILYKDMFMDISQHEKEETLLIIDGLEMYFYFQESDRSFKERMANHVKGLGKKGLSIMNDTGEWPYRGMIKER